MTDDTGAARLDELAREAWALMAHPRDPMPPFAALDYMLDGGDGSGAALEACGAALCRAAAGWLKGEMPRVMDRLYLRSGALEVLRFLADGLHGSAWSESSVFIAECGRVIRLGGMFTAGAQGEAREWFRWGELARSKTALVRTFCELCETPAPRK